VRAFITLIRNLIGTMITTIDRLAPSNLSAPGTSKRIDLDAPHFHHFRAADLGTRYVSVCLRSRVWQPHRAFLFSHWHPTGLRPKRTTHRNQHGSCLWQCPEIAACQMRHAKFHSITVRNPPHVRDFRPAPAHGQKLGAV
jgi:hypothetical protein